MRIQPYVIVLEAKEDRSKMFEVILRFHRMNWKVIKIWLNYVLNIMKSIGHSPLEGSLEIFQTKRELSIGKGSPRTDKGGFMLMSKNNIDQVVDRKIVHKRENLTPGTFVNNLIIKGVGLLSLGQVQFISRNQHKLELSLDFS